LQRIQFIALQFVVLFHYKMHRIQSASRLDMPATL